MHLDHFVLETAIKECIGHFLMLTFVDIHNYLQYLSLFGLKLRQILYPRGIWKDFSANTSHFIKCFCSFGCLVAVGCVILLSLTPFPCLLLRFDDEKNRKSRKRYMHFHLGSASAILLHFTKLITKWSLGFQKCTNTPHSVPRVCSWMICSYLLAKINNSFTPPPSRFRTFP